MKENLLTVAEAKKMIDHLISTFSLSLHPTLRGWFLLEGGGTLFVWKKWVNLRGNYLGLGMITCSISGVTLRNDCVFVAERERDSIDFLFDAHLLLPADVITLVFAADLANYVPLSKITIRAQYGTGELAIPLPPSDKELTVKVAEEGKLIISPREWAEFRKKAGACSLVCDLFE